MWNNSILIDLYNIIIYQLIIMWKSGNGQNFVITNSQIHFNVKDNLEQTVSL